jgi:predicted DNA-binding protein (MmcQ/YjbR family)
VTPEMFREFAINLQNASETFPFDSETPVFKVSQKMFGVLSAPGTPSPSATLKADPEDSIALREQYNGITPGYHMNKKHWITVLLDSDVPDELIEELVTASYDLVRPKRPRAR